MILIGFLWLVAERDVDGLVSKLKWLIEHPGEWRKMLDKGRKHIEAEFDVRRQGYKLGNLYKATIRRSLCKIK